MDLHAARVTNHRIWFWARLGAFVCFALAGVFLVASLAAPHAEPLKPAAMEQFR